MSQLGCRKAFSLQAKPDGYVHSNHIQITRALLTLSDIIRAQLWTDRDSPAFLPASTLPGTGYGVPFQGFPDGK
jgi:hypothetical protein